MSLTRDPSPAVVVPLTARTLTSAGARVATVVGVGTVVVGVVARVPVVNPRDDVPLSAACSSTIPRTTATTSRSAPRAAAVPADRSKDPSAAA